MEFTAQREQFAEAFGKCAAATLARSPKEILQSVHVTIDGSEAKLVGTDMETTVVVRTPVDVKSPGQVLLPVSRFSQMLRDVQSDQFTLSDNGSGFKFSAQYASYDIPSANPDEYPKPSDIEGTRVTLPASLVHSALHRTTYATDADSSRYALGGVRIEQDGDRLVFVGTDGRRMGCVHVPGCTGEFNGVVVPSKACELIQKFKLVGDVEITADLNNIQFTSGQVSLVSRLVEGRFPNWRQVIPNKDNRSTAKITAGSLASAIRQVAIVADTETRGILCEFTNDNLHLTSKSSEKGCAVVTAPMEYSGESVKLRVDYQFVLQFLKALESTDNVSVLVASPKESILFMDEYDGQYVVMPMAIEQ